MQQSRGAGHLSIDGSKGIDVSPSYFFRIGIAFGPNRWTQLPDSGTRRALDEDIDVVIRTLRKQCGETYLRIGQLLVVVGDNVDRDGGLVVVFGGGDGDLAEGEGFGINSIERVGNLVAVVDAETGNASEVASPSTTQNKVKGLLAMFV